ncbi:hypothetical protein, partial [Enterobacter asburiae]|uniref:hypothetical protein n=1 Tax=Enterobacter asburiae TaxID=61645 RepID=UPI001E3B0674
MFITTGSTLIKSAYLIDSEQANLRNVQADTTVRRKKIFHFSFIIFCVSTSKGTTSPVMLPT